MLKAIVTKATAALAVLALSGCISFSNGYGEIRTGMSPAQVRKGDGFLSLGFQSRPPYQSMTYTGKWLDIFQLQAADYSFVFEDDVLIEFGEGHVTTLMQSGTPALKVVQAGGEQQVAKPAESRICAAG